MNTRIEGFGYFCDCNYCKNELQAYIEILREKDSNNPQIEKLKKEYSFLE